MIIEFKGQRKEESSTCDQSREGQFAVLDENNALYFGIETENPSGWFSFNVDGLEFDTITFYKTSKKGRKVRIEKIIVSEVE